ncbi:carotenoid oxygenase family protein [Nocardioides pelophilus]|uniref:carotenoid oxygenase family protein n=1 Tax=Nocardioides pelophilus TaxID=2172019 RepID=UPI00160112F8|nr:carotenoid oxygenase family protein [Nocardioides pelophilus]
MANRYLTDNFAPVHEELTATDLSITGALPDHLDGRYLRIGPNPVIDPGDRYHWFLGDGMVHGVRLRDGRAAWYRNRWVRSAAVSEALGEEQRSAPGRFDFAANTNVIEHAGRTFALVEAGASQYELTAELDTVGACDFRGTLAGGYSAHPHEDPATGELHALSYSWTRGNRVDYTVLDVEGRIRRSVPVEVTGSPMIHDFALTERYAVVLDLPVTFDASMVAAELPRMLRRPAGALLSRVIGRNPVPEPLVARMARSRFAAAGTLPYTWNPAYPARIGLLPRDGDGSDVRWFEIDPCYVFHTVNAYEEGDTVVVDVVRHDRMFATDLTGPNEGAATLTRFVLDLTSGKVREDRFDERSQEFPRIDERLTGRRHRFGYAIELSGPAPGDAVVKHDLVAGTTQSRALGRGRQASEFCFVPTPGGTAEDDGVLMGYVFDKARGVSDLQVLDAQTLEDVATVHLPGRVPAGFHGNWAPTHPAG